MRLDKLLSHSNYGTRKETKALIRKGYVRVNDIVITNDDYKINLEYDEIVVFDDLIDYKSVVYLMLNKPQGYISATYDNLQKTVLDLIDDYKSLKLFPVGRLDKDTTGLLLITNDGKLAHKLLAPKNHVFKEYYVEFSGVFKEEYHKILKDGVILDDMYKCLSAYFIKISDNKGIIKIQEGKYHQVKRMFLSLNMEVTSLKRIKFGNLPLDESLEEGQYRHLTIEELEQLQAEYSNDN